MSLAGPGKVDEKKDYGVLKITTFPNFNRGAEPNMAEYKGYLKKFNNEEPNTARRFADFNFLLFLATLLGVETSCMLAQCVAVECKPDAETVSLLN